uniref:Uncharacterized protein n=1 Tax=Wuchereria bancrofti TaxID=6293 RepID=A0AAF5PLD4_WUCBA
MFPYCSNKLGIQIILCIAFFIESTQALGGIFGLKALTGNMPYIGYGNPWITYPRVAYGGAGLYSPYSSWEYGGSSGGNTGLSNSFTPLSGDGRYYRGRGNPWISQQ